MAKNPGGQGEHGVFHYVQGEHYQVSVVVSCSVGTLNHKNKRSPKNINLSPNYNFLGLSLLTTSLVVLYNLNSVKFLPGLFRT